MDEYQGRRDRLSALIAEQKLSEQKLEAMLVSGAANVRYLTGFTGSNGILLAFPDGAVFFTDPRYTLQAGREVSCAIRIVKGPLYPAAAGLARKKRIGRLGIERDNIRYDQYETLGQQVKLEPVSSIVEGLRAVKSPGEIEKIRRSVLTNSKAFEQGVRAIKPGMRESDLAAEIEYRMRRLGAEKAAFETIVAAGERAALPHARPGDARIENGNLVLIDMGATQGGYTSDMTRMVHLGPAPKKTRDTYRFVLEAQLAAIDAVRPGVTCARVDRAARDVLKAAGLDRAFVHSTGHGLGLEIHENPRLGKDSKTRLEAGMAITIEPGVYLDGWGGIRIEDTVVVTAAGCEVLTPTPKELREV
ncbi:MAG: peptidase [Bryobacterales bacterium]|nr:peptidase [Bryobacterales bacterium]